MTTFIAVAALLVVAVLAVLIPPLLRNRDPAARSARGLASNAMVYGQQLAELDAELKAGTISTQQWEASTTEIKRRVLEEEGTAPAALHRKSPWTAAVLALGIPVLAAGLYIWLGTPAALSPETMAQQEAGHSVTPEQIAAMVSRLAAKMEANPQDTDGWIMLGRSYAALGRFDEAATAYGKAARQRPTDADLLADYADILGMAKGRKLAGEPTLIIARALKADPENVKALALAGTAAFERADFRGALQHWQRAVSLIPEDSEFKQSLQSGISEARGHLGQGVAAGPAVHTQQRDAARTGESASAASLQGTVSLSPAMAKRANPDDTVFVFARAAQGPKMPLAVMRRKVSELPFSFSLDDSMAMTPAMKLSAFPLVVVVARISGSGLAAPQKGDLEAVSDPLSPTTKGIRLEIAKARD